MKRFFTFMGMLLLLLCLSSCAMIPTEVKRDTVVLSLDALRELDVELTSGELHFSVTDSDPYLEYTVRKSGIVFGDPEVRVAQNGAKTAVDTGRAFAVGGAVSYDLHIVVPRDAVTELSVEMTSGKTSLSGLSLDSLEVSLTSGRLQADDVTSRTLDLEATSGSAEVAGSFDAISVDATSGDFSVSTDVLPSSIDCELTSGKVSLYIPDDPAGFALSYTRTSGKVSSAFEMTGSVNDREGSLLHGNGFCQIDVDLTSGSVYIGKS